MKKIIRLLIFIMFGTSLLEASVGKITAISGNALLERGSSHVSAALGSSLESKDSIVTAKDSKAQLTFNDNTIITVGKQSKFSVEEYLFDATSDSTGKFNMVSGTIRVLSGKIGKIAPEKFAVKTKTATIGIRGTDFIVKVLPEGETPIYCMQGNITVRPIDNNESNVSIETVIVPAGSFVTVSAAGTIGDVKEFTTADIDNTLNEFSISPTMEVARTEPDPSIEFIPQALPVLNPDESIDRGSGVDIDHLMTDIGSSIATNTLNNVTDATPPVPQTFTGFATYLVRPQDGSWFSPLSNGVVVTLTSTPSTHSVTGSILDSYREMLIDLGSTNSYSSVDEFDVELASIDSPGSSGPLTANSHLWSASDTQNDYFSWGEWEIIPDPATSDDIFHGYWVAGVETPGSVIDEFRTATSQMTYSGNLIGEIVTTSTIDDSYLSSASISGGTINMYVDFGLDTFSANITANEYRLSYDGDISTNQLVNGSLSMFSNTAENFFSSASGSINGAFYGSTGKTVGGNFGAQANTGIPANNTIMIQGVFKATAP